MNVETTMLTALFPKCHRRYLESPVAGWLADFADWLAREGIVSISLNPDTVVETWQRLAKR